jgi:hypothetical protein
MSSPLTPLFKEFITKKYKSEQNTDYDPEHYDEDYIHYYTVAEYLEDWYCNMSSNICRRWINIDELMYSSIVEDDYELYQYDEDTQTFKEVEWDSEMAWVKMDYPTMKEKFSDCQNVFVAKYIC